MHARRCITIRAAALLLLTPGLRAQTASTATLIGTVTDPTGAVIPGADVALEDVATARRRSAVTSAEGHYTFVNVAPGDYRVTVTLAGFKQAVISLKVEVAKSYTVNVPLEVGEMTETVQVTATGAELQTLDATVGNVVQGEQMILLPNISGLPYWNIDMSFGKRTSVTESVRINFTADFLNVFNTVRFSNPTLNLLDPRSFGVITTQLNTPRSIQLGFRVEF